MNAHDGTKVRYETDGAVAIVTIDRPEVLNAIDRDVFAGLHAAALRAAADPEIRALVLTGAGRAFTSGLDTSLFASGIGAGSPIMLDIGALQRCFSVYEECR